ncbi:MAG: hypothetical protein RLZZ517_224 [Candidatus Parcubacteria bacterium]|jgi:uncharacterized membrane protein (DUF485 family)
MESNNNQNKFLSKGQKNFIGSTLSATGLIFVLISIMLFITLLILVGFKFGVLATALGGGDILTSLVVGLLATGIVSFAIGTGLQSK